jgi:hypothetical protein
LLCSVWRRTEIGLCLCPMLMLWVLTRAVRANSSPRARVELGDCDPGRGEPLLDSPCRALLGFVCLCL